MPHTSGAKVIVDHDVRVRPLEEPLNHVTADKTRSACDEIPGQVQLPPLLFNECGWGAPENRLIPEGDPLGHAHVPGSKTRFIGPNFIERNSGIPASRSNKVQAC